MYREGFGREGDVKSYLEDLGVNGRIIFQWILKRSIWEH
jgi:hypothetical protein